MIPSKPGKQGVVLGLTRGLPAAPSIIAAYSNFAIQWRQNLFDRIAGTTSAVLWAPRFCSGYRILAATFSYNVWRELGSAMVSQAMATPIRIAVLAVSALGALILAAVLAAWLLFRTDWAMGQVEEGLGEAMGMDVHIGQPGRFGLLPGVTFTLADLEVSTEGEVVATAEKGSTRLALFSLLAGKVRPIDLNLERPTLSVERYSPGVYNIRQPGREPRELKELSLRRFRATDAQVTYFDQASELELRFEDCDLDLSNIRHDGGVLEQVRATLAAEGELTCGTVSHDAFAATDLVAEIHGENGVFDLKPVSATAFEGQASGVFAIDFTSGVPRYSLQSRISELDLGAFMAMLAPQQSTTGKMDLEQELTTRGKTWQEVRNSATGTISLRSGELVLDGYDLDDELDNYADTQRFNLIDVGAVFLAGPLGIAATRGYAFSGLLGGSGGSTTIDRMVSEWSVEGGVVRARDVAFRTAENRLALAGALDFGDYRFDNMQVAVIDKDGCAVVEQQISGPFRAPEIERPNFLVAAAGPLLNLVQRGVRKITGGDCEVFYAGSISHP